MARVVAFIPDLLFGSNVIGALSAAGHDAVLVSDVQTLRAALAGAEVVVVDLTFEPEVRLEQVGHVLAPSTGSGPRTLAFYSHVESQVRDRAQAAGFDRVVPRSRMAREAPALIRGLLDQ